CEAVARGAAIEGAVDLRLTRGMKPGELRSAPGRGQETLAQQRAPATSGASRIQPQARNTDGDPSSCAVPIGPALRYHRPSAAVHGAQAEALPDGGAYDRPA